MKVLSRNQIVLDYANLPEGASLAGQLCPECEGGRSREYSLGVSMIDGTLKWMCHRASCGFAGVHQMSAGRVVAPSPSSPPTKRPVKFQSYPLDSDSLEFINNTYGIHPLDAGRLRLMWTDYRSESGKGRIVIPIRSRDHSIRGHVLRAIDSGDIPKAINVVDSSGNAAWFSKPGCGTLVIVEDCYSAIRASEYVNSVALLGTHLSSEVVDEIKESGLTNIYLALDKDATNISIAHATAYKNKLSIKVLPLKKDIKNMSEEELKELINDLK